MNSPLALPRWYKRVEHGFLSDVPIIGAHARLHREVCAQLRHRRPRCLVEWRDPIRLAALVSVAPIVKEYGRWPNTLFLPNDPCDLLFWKWDNQLMRAEAMMVILDEWRVPSEALDDVGTLLLGTLIDRLIDESDFLSDSDKPECCTP
jgi:hypothetical protein